MIVCHVFKIIIFQVLISIIIKGVPQPLNTKLKFPIFGVSCGAKMGFLLF